MKRNPIMTVLALLLVLSLGLQLSGCAGQTPNERPGSVVQMKSVDLMRDVKPAAQDAPGPVSADAAAGAADFALRLFRAGNESGRNTLLSPLSVLAALSMTANGARGETLSQMETVLGLKREEANAFFRSCLDALKKERDAQLFLANSIWFTADPVFQVNRDFLQTNADFYGAAAYQAPFDESTCADINSWVRTNTHDMIPEILDQIPQDAVMYLVNALAFEAKWSEPYLENDVRPADFTTESGMLRSVEMMYSKEGYYLEDEKATGFLKTYAGGRYAFAALLPKEGVAVEAYLSSLDGPALLAMLADPKTEQVEAGLPKFESAYGTELSELLASMGMEMAFGSRADFTGLGVCKDESSVFISRVLHKTFISVAEDGTRAGAATVVEMNKNCAFEPVQLKRVILDRPFVYMLIDLETGLPFFIGTMMDPQGEGSQD